MFRGIEEQDKEDVSAIDIHGSQIVFAKVRRKFGIF